MMKYIIIAHMENKSIGEVMSEIYEPEKLVARANTTEEAKAIYEWFKSRKKI